MDLCCVPPIFLCPSLPHLCFPSCSLLLPVEFDYHYLISPLSNPASPGTARPVQQMWLYWAPCFGGFSTTQLQLAHEAAASNTIFKKLKLQSLGVLRGRGGGKIKAKCVIYLAVLLRSHQTLCRER